MQISCDLENKTCDSIKNEKLMKAEVNDSIVMQTDCKVLDVDNIAASDDLCSDIPLQSNCTTKTRTINAVENIKLESTCEDHGEKVKVVSSDDNCTPCNIFEDNSSCSSKSACNETKNGASLLYLNANEITSHADGKQNQSELKLLKEEINVVNTDNSAVSVKCDSDKDSCKNLIPDKDSSVIPVGNTNVSVSVSSDCNNDILDCGDILSKNTLTDASTVYSDSLCGNSILSADVNVNVKSSDISNLDSNSSQLPSENSSLVSTASASATHKRKV